MFIRILEGSSFISVTHLNTVTNFPYNNFRLVLDIPQNHSNNFPLFILPEYIDPRKILCNYLKRIEHRGADDNLKHINPITMYLRLVYLIHFFFVVKHVPLINDVII